MTDVICGDPGVLGTLTTPARNRYFYGKLLDAFHFDLEQSYFNRKRWLLNRLGLGTGVVCGLAVAPTNNGAAIQIGPGVAIDGVGREIIVPAASPPVDPRQPTDDCGRPAGDPIAGAGAVTICLAYYECPAEPVPVLVSGCETERACAPSTIRERYAVLVRNTAATPITTSCGFPNLATLANNGTLHAALVNRISQTCPDPGPDVCVVLAQVTLPASGPITAANLDPSFRPVVYDNELLFELLTCLAEQSGGGSPPPPPPTLATVTGISWPHAGQLSFDNFMNGLTVTFSDTVSATSASDRGRGWFVVTVEYPVLQTNDPGPQFAVRPATILVQDVLASEIRVSGNQASFIPMQQFRETYLETLRIVNDAPPANPLCRIVLHCDFLLDSNRNPIDGDLLRGTLPSGDGVPGGAFESWLLFGM